MQHKLENGKKLQVASWFPWLLLVVRGGAVDVGGGGLEEEQ